MITPKVSVTFPEKKIYHATCRMHAHLNKSQVLTQPETKKARSLGSCYNSHSDTKFLQRNPLANQKLSKKIQFDDPIPDTSNFDLNPNTDQFHTGASQVPTKQGAENSSSEHLTREQKKKSALPRGRGIAARASTSPP